MPAKFSGDLAVTGSDEADQLLNRNPLALLLGMLLDQQIPMEWAFKGPFTLLERLGELDASRIASMDPAKFESICKEKPAIHRFPSSMAGRIQDLCEHLVENYDGDAEKIWIDSDSGETLYNRLINLPGFGPEKSMIFTALLAKRMGYSPPGWQESAGPFADKTPRSVADINSPESLTKVRAWKKAQKAAGKSKQE
jgi:uncharacterized HhH-GPD family protein